MAMENERIHDRLNLWAEWRIRRDSGSLGFPRKCAFVKDVGSSYWLPEMESASFEIEKCVVTLQHELKEAVMEKYIRLGTPEQKAMRLGIGERMFRQRLASARAEIKRLLDCIHKGVPLK